LENTLARAAIAARGRAILPEHLDPVDADAATAALPPEMTDPGEPVPLRALLAEVERRAIAQALRACQGNRTRTAERLGISRRQLFDKIREYDLHP
jgi:two-component system response regulator AtoC